MPKKKVVQSSDKQRAEDAAMRDAYKIRVYVVGGGFQYVKMFADAGFKGATSVDDADFICFTGGEDVDPRIYGEEPLPCTGFNSSRDARESGIYADAMMAKKPMVGICRGGQFLNVMNGGKMWQDVNNHALSGTHDIVDMKTGEVVQGMTSTHHQMMRPAEKAEILALASLSTQKVAATEKINRDKPEEDDVEVLWYSDSLSLCFQPHPEFSYGQCRDYFLNLVDEYIVPAC